MSVFGQALSARAQAVPASGIREILDAAVGLGGDVLRLEIGEPDSRTPLHIVEAAHAAATAGVGYTQSAGGLPLREVLAARTSTLTGHPCPVEQIVVTQGGVQGCALVVAALVSPGDEVLIPDPAWPNFEMQTLLCGGAPVRYPLRPEAGFLPDPDEIAGLITERTRVLVLNSPSNPTGAVFPADLVERIVDVAARRGVTVLSDEVYDQLVFEGSACNAVAYDPDNVVGLYSMSKTYAMTGWRVGYVAAPDWLARTLVRLQEAQLSCVSGVSQAAALAAVTGPQDVVAVMRATYLRRRDAAVDLCRSAGVDVVTPHGAFYLMYPFAPGTESRRAALDLVEAGVAVAPGSAFGETARDFARVSLCVDDAVLTAGLSRLISWDERTRPARNGKKLPVGR